MSQTVSSFTSQLMHKSFTLFFLFFFGYYNVKKKKKDIMCKFFVLKEDVSVSPRTSGRLSHSSGPLTDSCPVSPSEIDDIKVCFF